MSEYASGNYAVTDIRTGLDLSTQVQCTNRKHVCVLSCMQHVKKCDVLLKLVESSHALLIYQKPAMLLQHLACE